MQRVTQPSRALPTSLRLMRRPACYGVVLLSLGPFMAACGERPSTEASTPTATSPATASVRLRTIAHGTFTNAVGDNISWRTVVEPDPEDPDNVHKACVRFAATFPQRYPTESLRSNNSGCVPIEDPATVKPVGTDVFDVAGMAYLIGRAGSAVQQVRVEYDSTPPDILKPEYGAFVVVFSATRTATALVPIIDGRLGKRCEIKTFWTNDDC